MSCETVDNELLQSLLRKIIIYQFTRNFNTILKDRKISHSKLSEFTRGSGNWFNRTFNEIEDMRVSTFIKSYVAVSKILESQGITYDPIEITSVFNEELFKTASLSIDLSTIDDIDMLLRSDKGPSNLFLGLKVYVEELKGLRGDAVTPEETEVYYRVLERLKDEGGITNG